MTGTADPDRGSTASPGPATGSGTPETGGTGPGTGGTGPGTPGAVPGTSSTAAPETASSGAARTGSTAAPGTSSTAPPATSSTAPPGTSSTAAPGTSSTAPPGTSRAEPDARFTFANERTFLAWSRTGLALIVAGLGIVQLLPPFPGVPWGRHLIGIPLIVLGAVVAVAGYAEWVRNQRALRRGKPVPRSALPVILTATIAALAIVSAVVLLVSAFR